jgi:aminoglycoside 3-N-acetyltransferase
MFTTHPSYRRFKIAVKARLVDWRRRYVEAFRSYDPADLLQALRRLGVRDGDSLMLHSGFVAHHGFRGSIDALTQTFIEAVGPRGHLLMVSLPYRSSSLQYLQSLKQFDVRRTPSMMGLVSEFFRRRADVLRSLHPTHPMLVRGPEADWYIAGHEHCIYPCGPGTPFEKFAERDGIVVFFNVPFATFTFFHHLEHLVSAELPFPLYTEQRFEVKVIDRDGNPGLVHTHVFAPEAIRRRRFEVLEQTLRDRGLITSSRIGNTRLHATRVSAVVDCVREMSRSGRYFYDFDTAPTAASGASHADGGA